MRGSAISIFPACKTALNVKFTGAPRTGTDLEQILTERQACSHVGHERSGFGKRPALIVIDVNWFCGRLRPEPILNRSALAQFLGEDAWVALPYIRALIDKCHEKAHPSSHHQRAVTTIGILALAVEELRGNEDRHTIVSHLDGTRSSL